MLDLMIIRLSDVVISTVAILLLLPLMVAIFIAILVRDKHFPIYTQNRVGFQRKVFKIFKFKTMIKKTHSKIQHANTIPNNITPLGLILRNTQLDEIPQLFNVLIGQMSIIGPRPYAVVHDIQYSKTYQGYVARSKTKPGISGLAQIRGFHGPYTTNAKFKARYKLDIIWADNANFCHYLWLTLVTGRLFVYKTFLLMRLGLGNQNEISTGEK